MAAEQDAVDENGNKVAVILPLKEYQHLKEDRHDPAMVAERREEGTIWLAGLSETCYARRVPGSICRSIQKER